MKKVLRKVLGVVAIYSLVALVTLFMSDRVAQLEKTNHTENVAITLFK